jgi:hypothetical protein
VSLVIRYLGTEGYHAFRLEGVVSEGMSWADGSNALVEWCEREVGTPLPIHLRRKGYRPRWIRREYEYYDTFLFRDVADAVAFRLRWC